MVIVGKDENLDKARAIETEVFSEETASFDNGALCRLLHVDEQTKDIDGTLSLFDFDSSFDGEKIKLLGIGGVATRPDSRKKGVASEMMREAMLFAYKNGYDFSYLYPFSTAYYRKFGFSPCGELDEYVIKFDTLGRYKKEYTVRATDDGSTEINKLISNLYSNYGLYVAHPELVSENTFLIEDGEEIKGALSYYIDGDENDRIVVSTVFLFSDYKSFSTILSLLYDIRDKAGRTVVKMPPPLDIIALIEESADGVCSRIRHQKGMVRVTNALSVLGKSKPIGRGELILKINDGIISENSKTYHIISTGEKTQAVETNENPDIETDIEQFGQLITGRLDYTSLHLLPKTTLNCLPEKSAFLFHKKNIFIDVYF